MPLEEFGQKESRRVEELYILARRHFDKGSLREAARLCYAILDRQRTHGPTLQLLGALAHRNGRFGLAADCFRHATAAMPGDPVPRNNLATALKDWGRLQEAEAQFHAQLAETPDFLASHYNFGSLLQRLHRFDEAIACYRRAVVLEPDCVEAHWNLGLTLLRLGRFREGWPEYEWRWHRPGTPVEHRGAPAWDGGPLKGKTLLLVCEQGLGDTLQFIRYIRQFGGLDGPVILRCQAELLSLLRDTPGVDRIVATGDPLPPFDVQASLMSLPLLFGTTTVESIPADVPYLPPAAGPTLVLPESGYRVGLVWGSSPTDPSRSCPLAALARLSQVPDLRLFSLQKGPHASDLARMPNVEGIRDLTDRIGDMADTAALIRQLDLVITVDTSVAHLAGALGRPVFILLPHLADWRWLLDREDSPWYPTARLFRQRTPDDWDEVVTRLEEALVQRIRAWRSSR